MSRARRSLEVLVALERRWRFADVEVRARRRRDRGRRRPDAARRGARQPGRQRAAARQRRRSGSGRSSRTEACRFEVRDGGPASRRRSSGRRRDPPAWPRPAVVADRRRQPRRPGDAGRTGSRRRHPGGDLPLPTSPGEAVGRMSRRAAGGRVRRPRPRLRRRLGEHRLRLPGPRRRAARRDSEPWLIAEPVPGSGTSLRGAAVDVGASSCARCRSASCLRTRSRAQRRRSGRRTAVAGPGRLLPPRLAAAHRGPRAPIAAPGSASDLHPVEVTVSGAGALASAGGGRHPGRRGGRRRAGHRRQGAGAASRPAGSGLLAIAPAAPEDATVAGTDGWSATLALTRAAGARR